MLGETLDTTAAQPEQATTTTTNNAIMTTSKQEEDTMKQLKELKEKAKADISKDDDEHDLEKSLESKQPKQDKGKARAVLDSMEDAVAEDENADTEEQQEGVAALLGEDLNEDEDADESFQLNGNEDVLEDESESGDESSDEEDSGDEEDGDLDEEEVAGLLDDQEDIVIKKRSADEELADELAKKPKTSME